MKYVILPGLTTLTDWQSKIEEIDKLKLKEISLFLTGVTHSQRQKLYKLLSKTGLQRIPHAHLREDMRSAEIAYLIEKYKIRYLNIHPNKYFLPILKFKQHNKLIFIENLKLIDSHFNDYVSQGAGICIDFSHWEDFGVRLKNKGYDGFENIVRQNKVGCCHVSAIRNKIGIDPFSRIKCYSRHEFTDLSEFDYLKKYKKYLPKYISLELENSFVEQLKVKQYLERKII